jgi:hydrogenase maturation protease
VTARLLVAGVGNVFLGDDGFGVEVVRRLGTYEHPGWVRVADYGIRGMHLAYDLASGDYATTVLVDAAARGERPGTVSVVELDPPAHPADTTTVLDAHGMQPDVVLGLVALLGGDPGRVLLVGCEPAVLDQGMGLSPLVAAAIDLAVLAVTDIIREHEPDLPAVPARREQV